MKKDPLTGEEFEPKRSNQRFARPENRTKYHNDKAKARMHQNAFIDKPLKTNQKILDGLMEGKLNATFHKEFLRGKGYDKDVFNGIVETAKGTGFCLYNYILIFEKFNVHVYKENGS